MGRRFVHMMSYRVQEMSLGPYGAKWLADAGQAWAGAAGLEDWRVLQDRNDPQQYTELFTWTDRDAYRAAHGDESFKATWDDLLERLGALVDLDSVEITFHEVIVPRPAPP